MTAVEGTHAGSGPAAARPSGLSARRARRVAVGLTIRAPALFVRRDLAGVSRSYKLHGQRMSLAALAAGLVAMLLLSQLPSTPKEAARGMRPGEMAEIAQGIFHTVLLLQVFVAATLAPLWGIAALSLERSRGTWGLLVLTRLGTGRTVLGKLASILVQVLALVLSMAPIHMLCLFFGGIGLGDAVAGAGAVLATAFLGASVGLGCGAREGKPLAAVARLVLVVGSLYAVAPAAALYGAYRAGVPEDDLENAMLALHPLVIVVHACLESPPGPRPVWTSLPVALGASLPLQALLFLLYALRAARHRSGSGRRRRVARLLASLRWDAATWMALLLGGPTAVFAVASLALGASEAYLWSAWFWTQSALTFVAVPFMASLPLSRGRQTGALSVLLTTPMTARRICLRAVAAPLVVTLGTAFLLECHLLSHETFVRPRVGSSICSPILPLNLAGVEAFTACVALMISMASRSALHSVGTTLVAGAVVLVGPFPMAAFLFDAGWDVAAELLVVMSPLSFLGSDGGDPAASVVLFACLAALGFIFAYHRLEPLQRRYLERGP